MKLKVKDVNLSTGGPLIVILNKKDASKLDLFALDRVRLIGRKKSISAVINITESPSSIKPGEIGCFEETLKELNLKSNSIVRIKVEPRPSSLEYIKKKLDGFKLTRKEYYTIIQDIVLNKLSEVESTYFVSAIYSKNLTLDEVAYLTDAMVSCSSQLNLKKKIIVDKHSVSGIPGNRTTPIVIPILAAAGLTVPKTSSRAITSPSGTADTFECLAPVSLSKEQVLAVIKKTNACIVWGGTLDLASADDKLIKLERPLALDPEGVLLSSILSKKKAVNSTHVLIDIPYGREAKIETKSKALSLKDKFEKLGKKLGIKVKAVLTDGSQPIGNGIGPVLEAKDCIEVLLGNGPLDLKRKSIMLANKIFGMVNVKADASQLIDSGKAFQKLMEIIKAQGGKIPPKIELSKIKKDILAYKSGKIIQISNKSISRLARIAGAPQDKKAGIYLNVHINDKIKKDSILFTLYAESKQKLNFALEELNTKKIIIIN